MTKIYGDYRLIGSYILPHFGLLKSEIGPLGAEKIKFVNIDRITCVKSTFKINF